MQAWLSGASSSSGSACSGRRQSIMELGAQHGVDSLGARRRIELRRRWKPSDLAGVIDLGPPPSVSSARGAPRSPPASSSAMAMPLVSKASSGRRVLSPPPAILLALSRGPRARRVSVGSACVASRVRVRGRPAFGCLTGEMGYGERDLSIAEKTTWCGVR